ncbi:MULTISPECIES: helix-turn-helix domain-containing protein [Gordonia]|uniref:helix-turn-helix domain-containing protein n=1 Tax=Gordonia TaxID=2053 RepID=UPI00034B219D|nr:MULTISPECIES: helix-turn-helix domain-containing protein [Gordonia]AUH70461.1 excisionase [Gordonia sp. YC-JH1]
MEWLTVAEAAAFAKVSEKTIRRWYTSGRLEVDRLGPRLVRIRRSALLDVAA